MISALSSESGQHHYTDDIWRISCDGVAWVEGQSAGHRFIVRQIASASPSGPESPNTIAYRELPATLSETSKGARRKVPTRSSAAVLPSQSVALTNAGEAMLPPENPGSIRG